MADEDTQALHERFELLKGAEHHKNSLIEELLRRLDTVSQDYQNERLAHLRESHFNRDVQLREMQLQEELRKTKAMMERDAFILVLIDGDGMIFEDHLINKGEVGGREAAGILWAAIRDLAHERIPNLSSDVKIMTRIYANLKGLGDVCHRAGILDKPSTIEDFARGFTGSKQLFDFVDVGSGKDRADDKLSEIFKLHLYDCHCRHIFFGCSHDNGYARLLEETQADRPVLERITLLEGVPFEKELAGLKSQYKSAKIESLFRSTKINVYQQPYYQQPTAPQALPAPYQSPYQPGAARTPSASTTSSSMNPMASSWASTAISTPPHVTSPPPTPKPTASKTTNEIPRNRYGQRVDPYMEYDKNEVKRVQKIHMCNVHYLRHDCPYGDECTHDHFYSPNKNELKTLKYVARMTPCRFGTDCDDAKCIYGHRCPSGIEGRKDCRFGENCRFDRDMHGIDMNVVKTTKV
ncbi:Zinc finger, CCCH-type [Lasallia pustulata]|uniref:Zinc finger, CCCH-type n=1 Tax=Lasallia pustulata TaxID=136370 RepID=A0A1W5D5E2_9LECA|nr:Zinc finger, CCCH-type [Lasallia pustulata]